MASKIYTFDEATHTHRIGGVVVPGITTVLKPLQDFSTIPPHILEAKTISKIVAGLETASTSGNVVIDVQKSGDHGATWATILSTKITIEANEYSSLDAATQPVLSNASLSANDRVKIIVDSQGTGAAYLTVTLLLTKSVAVA